MDRKYVRIGIYHKLKKEEIAENIVNQMMTVKGY